MLNNTSNECNESYYNIINLYWTISNPYDDFFNSKEYYDTDKRFYSIDKEEDNNENLENQKYPLFNDKEEENNLSVSVNKDDKISPEIKLNIASNIITGVTAVNSVLPVNQIITFPKRKIFEVKREKKIEKVRKRNNKKKKVHTKANKDNILIKIHRKVLKYTLKFINSKLNKSKNSEINCIKLKKIDNSIFRKYNNKVILELLKMKLKDLLSFKLSGKFLKQDKDYNKKKIDYIFEHGDEEIKNLLNLTFKEILDIYCSNNNSDFFIDFIKIDDDIKIFQKQNLEQNYIEKYENIAKNYESIINSIYPRPKSQRSK